MNFRCAAAVLWILAWAHLAHASEPWPSVINLRDVGGKVTQEGLCVRRHVVFRSGHFDHVRHEDAAALVQLLHLADYYDLRVVAKESASSEGPEVLRDAGVRYHNLPIDAHEDPMLQMARPGPDDWAGFYERTLSRDGATFVQLITALAHGESPSVFGCSLGKDRTGIAAALLLAILGVPDEAIVADYVASTEGLAAHLDDFRDAYARRGLSREAYQSFWATAHAATMQHVLHILSEHGGVVAALRSVGLTPALVQDLRARLLAVSLADCV